MNYQIKEPYPKINIQKKSRYVANLLSHVYASNEGELTAVHLYIYQSLVLNDSYPQVAEALKKIGEVEMRHLFLLGEAIEQLGNPPIYADCNFNMENYWNADYVYYDQDLKTILEIDIESESQAIHNYQLILMTVEDIEVQKLIQRIILDEQLHLKIFQDFYQQLIAVDNC